MIYDDYIDYSTTYQQKYGEKTVVFMQVGDFFEIYAINNEVEKVGADIYTVCDICNIQVSRKNKGVLENNRQNPLMAGFPIAIVAKHIQTLVNHGYTVVLIRQVTPPPNPKREVTEIISPSTNSQAQGYDNTFLMVLHWEAIPTHYGSEKKTWTVGMCSIDVTTGDVMIGEAYPRISDPNFAKDEAYRWIQSIQPKEIIFTGNGLLDEEKEDLLSHLQVSYLRLYRSVHEKWDHDKSSTYQKISYQEQVFEKLYPKHGIVPVIEAYDLERRDLIRVAFMYGIDFVFEHNERMVQCLKTPIYLEMNEYLNVHYNGLLQMNVISNVKGEKPLLSLLNRCSTAFGSRLFKEMLLNPICNTDKLEERYSHLEWMYYCPYLVDIQKALSGILDLERFSRRLMLEQLSPCEWVSVKASVEQVKKAHVHIMNWIRNNENPLPNRWISDKMDSLQDAYTMIDDFIAKYMIIEEAGKYWLNDIRGNFFKKGIYTELDLLQDQVDIAILQFESFANQISNLGENDQCACKVDSNERDGYFLTMTKRRWETAVAKAKERGLMMCTESNQAVCFEDWKAKPISSSSSIVRLTHTYLDDLSHRITSTQKRLTQVVTQTYQEFLKTHKESNAESLQHIVQVVSEIDVLVTNARNAIEYAYKKPTIDHESEKSYMKASQMRHPIIERIQQGIPYVPNDVVLGQDKDGWLLYGINASGKSSLMKAIGLTVLMAQAGMYVPCDQFTYHPYQYIFTRISGADNIYRGMSSFTVEMSELKNILLRCNDRSLVLGDELCAGTESLSALSIVASGIEYLAKQRSSFVFATHLHELIKLDCVPENVDIYHIHIELDQETGKIIYDRHITKGHGHAYYGLEVCQALQLPPDFITRAHYYRRKIQEEPESFVQIKPSNYNASIYVDRCGVCGKVATETHHIQYQKDATGESGKHVNHIPLHMKGNLIPLCEGCHKKEHHGELEIKGYQQTSNGKELIITNTSIVNKSKKTQTITKTITKKTNKTNKTTTKQVDIMTNDAEIENV